MPSDSMPVAPTRTDVALYEADVEHLAESIYRREQGEMRPAWEAAFPTVQERCRQQARSMLALLRSSGFTVERRVRADATQVVAQIPTARATISID